MANKSNKSKKSKKFNPIQKAESMVKRYLLTAVVYSLILACIGIFMIIFPGLSLDILRWSLVVILVAMGVYAIVSDFMNSSILTMYAGSVGGVLMLVLGIIIAMYPGVLSVIPIILGVFIIISSTFSLRLSSSIRATSTAGFFISMLTSIIAIVCGIILIINPAGSAIALTTFVGIMITIYAVVSLVDLAILRAHLQDVADNLKDRYHQISEHRQIVEGEEVDDEK